MNPDTSCKISKTALMLDMSGMVSCCQHTKWWLKNNNGEHYTVDHNLEEVWKSDSRRRFADALDSGERLPSCQECWTKEDLGMKSLRQLSNEMLTGVEEDLDQPQVIIIKPGNKCNNACRSCNEHTSTLWYKDAYEFDREQNPTKTFKEWLVRFKPHTTLYKDNTQLEQTFDQWQEKIVFWDIYGGEPLIIPLSYKIVKSCIDSGFSHKQMLQIHTNTTIYDPDLKEMFSKFKEIRFVLSLDAVGPKNNYIRTGSNWDEVLNAITQYQEDFKNMKNIKLSLRACTTQLNIYDIDDTCNFFKNTGLQFSINNFPTDQPHNNIQYIPRPIKDAISQKISQNQHPLIKEVIQFMMGTPPDYETHMDSFWKHNNKLDQLRGENFKDTFPEYYKLWADYYKL